MPEEYITPRVRALLICERVDELEEGVFHLYGVRHQFEADQFPFSPLELWAYALFSAARAGSFPAVVSIYDAATGKILFMKKTRLDFAVDGQFQATCFLIQCRFPQPGEYPFQLSFFQPALEKSDIIKAEMPFWIY
jgi:hypothetical protein